MSILPGDPPAFAKILIVLAIVCIVAMGVIWLATTLPSPLGPDPEEKLSVGVLGDAAAVVVLLSGAGFVLTIAAWVGLGVFSSFSRKEAEPQRLFYPDEKTRTTKRPL
jgi:hypothetical protein